MILKKYSQGVLTLALLVFSSGVCAADAPPERSPEDLDLGRRYLQCTGFWGMSAPILRMAGGQVDQAKLTRLRTINELAALTLMGEELARKENDAQKLKFIEDSKTMGGVKAIDSWSQSCAKLMEDTLLPLVPRIEAYLKARDGEPKP